MNLLLGCDAQVTAWVGERLGQRFDATAAVGVLGEDETMIGAVAFHTFTGQDIVISAAADTPRWLTRGLLRVLGQYVFRQLGCRRCTAIVAKRNHRSRAAVERLGFEREGRLRKYFGDQDAIIYGLLREEWRFK